MKKLDNEEVYNAVWMLTIMGILLSVQMFVLILVISLFCPVATFCYHFMGKLPPTEVKEFLLGVRFLGYGRYFK